MYSMMNWAMHVPYVSRKVTSTSATFTVWFRCFFLLFFFFVMFFLSEAKRVVFMRFQSNSLIQGVFLYYTL